MKITWRLFKSFLIREGPVPGWFQIHTQHRPNHRTTTVWFQPVQPNPTQWEYWLFNYLKPNSFIIDLFNYSSFVAWLTSTSLWDSELIFITALVHMHLNQNPTTQRDRGQRGAGDRSPPPQLRAAQPPTSCELELLLLLLGRHVQLWQHVQKMWSSTGGPRKQETGKFVSAERSSSWTGERSLEAETGKLAKFSRAISWKLS